VTQRHECGEYDDANNNPPDPTSPPGCLL
jgi:hypothetical protein